MSPMLPNSQWVKYCLDKNMGDNLHNFNWDVLGTNQSSIKAEHGDVPR